MPEREKYPSSNPSPDKKASNEKTPSKSSKSGKSSQLKSVVSEASVLPPPQSPYLPEPTPPSQTSSRGNLSQQAAPRPQTSQAPQSPSVGYKGTSDPQRTVKDIMLEYPGVKVKNSGPTGTPLRKHAIQNPGNKKTFIKQPIYLHPMQNRLGSLVKKDARRTWEAAVIVSPEWLYQKNMCPPNHDEHAKMKKMNVSVFLGRPLRAAHSQASEPAWLSRAVNILPGVEDNYLDSLNIDLRNQFEDRYTLLTGETFAINSRYARDLEAQLPMPKERLQRARYVLVVDSTILKNVPIDNVLSDLMVMTIPLSRITEMAEMVVAMFDS